LPQILPWRPEERQIKQKKKAAAAAVRVTPGYIRSPFPKTEPVGIAATVFLTTAERDVHTIHKEGD